MNCWKTMVCSALLAEVISIRGQGEVNLSIRRATNGWHLAWQSQSVVPSPGMVILPSYTLERTADLRDWRFVGERAPTNQNQLIDFTILPEERQVFRVSGLGDLTGAALMRAPLTNANFSGAILVGANLFEAGISGADLTKADLSGADLRRA